MIALLPHGTSARLFNFPPAPTSFAQTQTRNGGRTDEQYARDLRAAIDRSRTITEYGEDWDGEGAPGYAFATWERATQFLRRQAQYALTQFGAQLGIPCISPADEGSIDLYWRGDDRKLLVNFPADVRLTATYYGEDVDGNTTAGEIKTDARSPADLLVQWLVRRH